MSSQPSLLSRHIRIYTRVTSDPQLAFDHLSPARSPSPNSHRHFLHADTIIVHHIHHVQVQLL